jgi:phosphatidylinositol glycan class W
MIDQPRKYQDKEAFVTGHSGSSLHEILLMCTVIPVGLHLYCKLLPYAESKHKIFFEFGVLILPMMVVQTSLLGAVGNTMLLVSMMTVAYLLPAKFNADQEKDPNISNESKKPAFLSIHRSSVYLLTTIAILAVDFPIFPRKYCKTETCGYGWMDLGAASFVIIAGWTSSLSSPGRSSHSVVKKAIKKCAPLLLLGVIRLLTNKGLEYQEHVSEYGVHWNFFFTLCFMELIVLVWRRLKPSFGGDIPLDGIVATVTMMTYQMFLSSGGQDFIENGERRCTDNESWSICDVFYANREGILGLIGYVSLRLLSEEMGWFCLRSGRRHRNLVVSTLFLWGLHFVFTIVLQVPTSRRTTNLPFVLWALAHNMTILLLLEYVATNDNKSPIIPCILNAVNRNGLAVFLISNILTGLVNLTVDTLHASNEKAMVILLLYLAAVCGSAVSLDKLMN